MKKTETKADKKMNAKSGSENQKNAKDQTSSSGVGRYSFLLGALIGVLIFGIAWYLGKSANKKVNYEKHTYTYWDVLDTVSTIQVYLKDGQDPDYYENWIHEELLGYHQLFDAYHSYPGLNNVYTINEMAGKEPVAVDEKLFDLVDFCMNQMGNTRNRTNIAFGTVTAIWKQFMTDCSDERALALKEDRAPVYTLPNESVLNAAAEHIDPMQVILDKENHTVYLADSMMRLDVGAAAKGYICEVLAQDMKAAGIESSCIVLGGNVKVIGQYRGTDDRTYFTSAVKNPEDPNQYLNYILKISDQDCVVTSGNYERFVDIDGMRYCHLIDPDTMYPTQGMSGVTIICKDSGLADYLSTALFSVNVETGKEILTNYPGVEACWITDQYEIFFSDHFMDYVIQQ